MIWDGQERRKFPRATFPCRIAVGSPVRWLVSHTDNMGINGIKVILEERIRTFTPVSLELFFEKQRSIKCKGKIVWVKEVLNPIDMDREPIMFVTGIEFTEIIERDKKYIKNLVTALSILEETGSGLEGNLL